MYEIPWKYHGTIMELSWKYHDVFPKQKLAKFLDPKLPLNQETSMLRQHIKRVERKCPGVFHWFFRPWG
jgi:hypothetical protein